MTNEYIRFKFIIISCVNKCNNYSKLLIANLMNDVFSVDNKVNKQTCECE